MDYGMIRRSLEKYLQNLCFINEQTIPELHRKFIGLKSYPWEHYSKTEPKLIERMLADNTDKAPIANIYTDLHKDPYPELPSSYTGQFESETVMWEAILKTIEDNNDTIYHTIQNLPYGQNTTFNSHKKPGQQTDRTGHGYMRIHGFLQPFDSDICGIIIEKNENAPFGFYVCMAFPGYIAYGSKGIDESKTLEENITRLQLKQESCADMIKHTCPFKNASPLKQAYMLYRSDARRDVPDASIYYNPAENGVSENIRYIYKKNGQTYISVTDKDGTRLAKYNRNGQMCQWTDVHDITGKHIIDFNDTRNIILLEKSGAPVTHKTMYRASRYLYEKLQACSPKSRTATPKPEPDRIFTMH